MQELDDGILAAARLNNAVVVSKWLEDLPAKELDVTTRDRLVQILKQAAQCLSVDVIAEFAPPSEYNISVWLIICSHIAMCVDFL